MKSIVMLGLEFTKWQQARAWSYTGSYSFIDGFKQNNIKCMNLPLFCEGPKSYTPELMDVYKQLLEEKFDEVWVWCVHTQLSKENWTWIKTIAPKVVGVVMETLQHNEEESLAFPNLQGRCKLVIEELSHCTHALLVNQSDAEFVNNKIAINTMVNLPIVTEKYILSSPPPQEGVACFIGSCYGERERYLKQGLLDDILVRPDIPERQTSVPEEFDSVCREFLKLCLTDNSLSLNKLEKASHNIHEVRKKLFKLHLEGIRMGRANVNLPSLVKAYPGRVIESMAACVPVLSYPPQCRALENVFIKNEEILLFDSPEKLREQYTKLLHEKGVANDLVVAARKKLLLNYTSEKHVERISEWLDQT